MTTRENSSIHIDHFLSFLLITTWVEYTNWREILKHLNNLFNASCTDEDACRSTPITQHDNSIKTLLFSSSETQLITEALSDRDWFLESLSAEIKAFLSHVNHFMASGVFGSLMRGHRFGVFNHGTFYEFREFWELKLKFPANKWSRN